MQVVYASSVMFGGYIVMNWAIGQSEKNIGVNGEKLRSRRDLQHSGTALQNAALGELLQKASQKQHSDSSDGRSK